jgi:hypothetical protein
MENTDTFKLYKGTEGVLAWTTNLSSRVEMGGFALGKMLEDGDTLMFTASFTPTCKATGKEACPNTMAQQVQIKDGKLYRLKVWWGAPGMKELDACFASAL